MTGYTYTCTCCSFTRSSTHNVHVHICICNHQNALYVTFAVTGYTYTCTCCSFTRSSTHNYIHVYPKEMHALQCPSLWVHLHAYVHTYVPVHTNTFQLGRGWVYCLGCTGCLWWVKPQSLWWYMDPYGCSTYFPADES